MRPARARKTGRWQQAEGGLFCRARSREAAGKKGVASDPDGRRVRSDRGYGDGEAASPEEARIGVFGSGEQRGVYAFPERKQRRYAQANDS
jgi:hypothetical protein